MLVRSIWNSIKKTYSIGNLVLTQMDIILEE